LINHYNKDHPDLVRIGLKLKLSKAKKRELRVKKAQEKAGKLLLDGAEAAYFQAKRDRR